MIISDLVVDGGNVDELDTLGRARRVGSLPVTARTTWPSHGIDPTFPVVVGELDLADANDGPAFLFLATTGVRRGEALWLRWHDLDLEVGRVKLRQTTTAVAHRIHIEGDTKTHKPRGFELDTRTVATLRRWRATQAAERLAIGDGYASGDLVFCLPTGKPYHPERFSREFDRRVARHGLPKIRLHDLRHTWATLALEAGVPLKVVSERLGHATTAITADIYSHVVPALDRHAAETVAASIFGL